MADPTAVSALIQAWKESPPVVGLGTMGIMAQVAAKREMGRADVCRNVASVRPIIEHLGTLAALILDKVGLG